VNLSRPLDGLVDPNVARVLYRLAILPQGETGRRIHELSGVGALRTTQRILGELVSIGLVDVESVGPSNRYALNRSHILWGPVEALFASPARIEQRIAETFADAAPGNSLAIYGSAARGDADRDSDIDILIVWDTPLSLDDREEIISRTGLAAVEATGNNPHIVDIDNAKLLSMAASHDPLTDSWLSEARTLVGTPVAQRIRKARR
jgi:hypothetical protein